MICELHFDFVNISVKPDEPMRERSISIEKRLYDWLPRPLEFDVFKMVCLDKFCVITLEHLTWKLVIEN